MRHGEVGVTATRYATIVADPPWRYDEGFPQGPARQALGGTELVA